MALARVADRAKLTPEWLDALEAIEEADTDLGDVLEQRGLDRPWVLANLVDLEPDLTPTGLGPEDHKLAVESAARNEWISVLGRFGLTEGLEARTLSDRVDLMVALQKAALVAEAAMLRQSARVTDLEVAVEEARRAKRQKHEHVVSELTRLQADAWLRRPRDWKGKTYTRDEKVQNPDEQREAESKETRRWSKALLQAILEADLPLAEDIRSSPLGLEDPSVRRACRGHRWTTLKKRVLDLRPLSRFLRSQGAGTFPASEQEVLDYFKVRQAEGAARGVYKTLLTTLNFFEAAGEVEAPDRLSSRQSLANAALEAAAQKAREADAAGETRDKHQAPALPLVLVVHLERVVLDLRRPVYQRAFAWYRLVRHWSSLRFDDTLGLSPQAIQQRARGILAILRRTKTSGPDKQRQALPAFLSQHAWVEAEWLQVGLELWTSEEHGLGFKRDYLLSLPDKLLAGTCGKRARDSDAAGFSRALFATLVDESGDPLLLQAALSFWTEHSDRAGLDSWAAALNVPGDLRGFLGRWGAQGSQDAYVRTAARVQENVQILAARHGRLAFKGGPDFFGEEHLLENLRQHLLAKGVDAAEAQAQLDRLKCSDFTIHAAPLATYSDGGDYCAFSELLSLPELADRDRVEWAPVASSSSTAATPAPPAAEAEGTEAPEDDLDEDFFEQDLGLEVAEAVALQVRDTPESPQGFVVEHQRGGRLRRLHFARACRRVPGEHYKVFIDWGEVMPADHEFDDICDKCYPPASRPTAVELEAAAAQAEEPSENSESSGSESSG